MLNPRAAGSREEKKRTLDQQHNLTDTYPGHGKGAGVKEPRAARGGSVRVMMKLHERREKAQCWQQQKQQQKKKVKRRRIQLMRKQPKNREEIVECV